MPSFTGSPLRITLTGRTGYFTPGRFQGAVAGAVRITGGRSGRIGPAEGTSADAVTIPELDYLDSSQPLVDAQGRPTAQFQFFWQAFRDSIVASFTAVDDRDTFQQSLIDRLTAAEALAAAANDKATAASEAAEQTFEQIDPTLRDYYSGKYDGFYYI